MSWSTTASCSRCSPVWTSCAANRAAMTAGSSTQGRGGRCQPARRAAETRRRESEEQLEALQKQTASYQSNQRESQKNANIWQLKHHDLQQKNDDLQKQVEELQKQLDSARQLNTSSLSAPASDLVREAKLEAGKILADARLYAESAEKELKQQADSQKNRMAENARSIASGACWYGSVWPAWMNG